ncbi:hypothetical protein Acr_19g0007630 [Actinidia rufa]|uniref:Uncharacterized protein n=1 Tax=Actinidia rufa TaxID=165716 RepID=A0A7J0GAI2_9ERIC|nr:hypothetical protein Acr_19g0007630 [Actinidia rufa]
MWVSSYITVRSSLPPYLAVASTMAGHADDLDFNLLLLAVFLELDEKSREKVSHYRDQLFIDSWIASQTSPRRKPNERRRRREIREWRGAIAIFGFAESIGELDDYTKKKGVRVSEVVCLDDVEVTDKEIDQRLGFVDGWARVEGED